LKSNLDKVIDEIINKNFKENMKNTQKASSIIVANDSRMSQNNSDQIDEIKRLLNK